MRLNINIKFYTLSQCVCSNLATLLPSQNPDICDPLHIESDASSICADATSNTVVSSTPISKPWKNLMVPPVVSPILGDTDGNVSDGSPQLPEVIDLIHSLLITITLRSYTREIREGGWEYG